MSNESTSPDGDHFLPELDEETDDGASMTPLLDEILAAEGTQAAAVVHPDFRKVNDAGVDLTKMRLPTSRWVSQYIN